MTTPTRAAFIAASVSLLLFPTAHDAKQAASRPNVLLVTLDTVRADRIGAYGYKQASTPNLDRLAREGVLFTDATTQSPLTAPAHAALLTGQYPGRLGIKSNAGTPVAESALTVAEMFKAAGYRTSAFIGAFILDRQYGFAQGFDAFDATFRGFRSETKESAQRTADEVIAPALSWLSQIPAGSPFFAWVHLYDAHAPYSAPAPFGPKFSARPYDGEIAYVDAAVGKLLAQLNNSGVLDRTIVVAVGDHGEALGDHGEEDHGIFLYESVMRIPWVMRLPKSERAGTIVAEQVRSIDLTPTLLELAGVPAKARADGESLASVMRGRARRDPPPSYSESYYPQLHFGWSMLRALRVGEWKYIDAPRPELYDLRTDREERRNLVAERGSVSARMAGELETIAQSFGAAADTVAPQPDPETLERLRSLGYLGLAAPSPRGARGADPKDKIADMQRFRALLTSGIDDVRAGRHDAGIDKLKRAAAINERAYDAHAFLGWAWQQKGEHERALGEYDAAALLNPNIAAPHLLAADAYLAQGKFDRALERIDRAARLEPRSGEVAFVRGRVYERSGRLEEALAEYGRAIDTNASDLPAKTRFVSVAMNLGRFDLAEPQLKLLLSLNHEPGRTHFALGYIAEQRGDRAAAEAEYRRALAADPKLQAAREALARVSRR